MRDTRTGASQGWGDDDPEEKGPRRPGGHGPLDSQKPPQRASLGQSWREYPAAGRAPTTPAGEAESRDRAAFPSEATEQERSRGSSCAPPAFVGSVGDRQGGWDR